MTVAKWEQLVSQLDPFRLRGLCYEMGGVLVTAIT
jgi:hypothetical protein